MPNKTINLSINPSYHCNFDCSFCYLTPQQLKDTKRLDLKLLEKRLNEVRAVFNIGSVDLYGGEIALLPNEYLESVASLVSDRSGELNAITNLSKISPFFLKEEVEVSVSWEGNIRRQSEKVWDNLQGLNRPAHVLMCAGPEMANWSEDEIDAVISRFNKSANVHSVEIKPYSRNQANAHNVSFRDYEETIKRWLKFEMDFIFVNKLNLEDALSGKAQAFSDDHLYIAPSGNYSVLEFDEDDREYFLELKTLEECLAWMNREKQKVYNNGVCSQCEYLGGCLSEHLREVKDLKNSCNGFYDLIKWYERL